jgi:hypothetical protein
VRRKKKEKKEKGCLAKRFRKNRIGFIDRSFLSKAIKNGFTGEVGLYG